MLRAASAGTSSVVGVADMCRHTCTGYVHLHGSRAQLALIDRIAELEARHAALLAQLPEQARQKFRRRHAEASEAPGMFVHGFFSGVLVADPAREC